MRESRGQPQRNQPKHVKILNWRQIYIFYAYVKKYENNYCVENFNSGIINFDIAGRDKANEEEEEIRKIGRADE